MYKITYKNNNTATMSEARGAKLELLKKQNCLSVRQRAWLDTVKSIEKVRVIDQHRLHLTKDIGCDC